VIQRLKLAKAAARSRSLPKPHNSQFRKCPSPTNGPWRVYRTLPATSAWGKIDRRQKVSFTPRDVNSASGRHYLACRASISEILRRFDACRRNSWRWLCLSFGWLAARLRRSFSSSHRPFGLKRGKLIAESFWTLWLALILFCNVLKRGEPVTNFGKGLRQGLTLFLFDAGARRFLTECCDCHSN